MTTTEAIAATIAAHTPIGTRYQLPGTELTDAPHSPFSLAFEQSERELGERIGYPVLVYHTTAPTSGIRFDADSTIAALRKELEEEKARSARAWDEIAGYRAVVDDAVKRYSYIYGGWREAKSNEEIADVVRKGMFNWEETRRGLYESSSLRAELDEAHQHIGALVASNREMRAAMRDYAMDVDEDPPFAHREMMAQAYTTITAARTWLRREAK